MAEEGGEFFFDAFHVQTFHNGSVPEEYGLEILERQKVLLAGQALADRPDTGRPLRQKTFLLR